MPNPLPDSRGTSSDKADLTPRGAPFDLDGLIGRLTGETTGRGNRALITFLENSPDPILLFDEDSELIGRNERAVRYWDGSEDFIPPRLVQEIGEVAACLPPGKEERKERLVAIEASGGRRYFLPTVFHLTDIRSDANEDPSRKVIACILKDETVWKRAESIRNNLVASISHELNTPLTSARLALYLLAEQRVGKLNATQKQLVEGAKQDLDREITTIQNVLDMIRFEGNTASDGETEPINLHELIEEVISDFEPQIREMDLPIRRDYSAASPWVAIEKETAQLVIYQLFVSILKYSDENARLGVVTSTENGECTLDLVTENEDQEDFPPDDLFTMTMENQQLRDLRCADLGLRVAHEIISPFGGALSCEHLRRSGKLRLRFPRVER